jgi:type VI secretion system protein ImpK
MEIRTIIPNLNDLGIHHVNFPVPSHHAKSYYRSKIFTSQVGINPLITAASPLFSMIEKLKKTDQSPELSKLHYDLVHEIKAFENKAQALGYRSQITYAARYLLCTWIDEIIIHSSWIDAQEWEKRTLVNNFQHNIHANDQFFILLNHCKQDASVYIDLLEMMYLCLCLGYEGEYRHLDHGLIQLSKVMEDLYECIHTQRGDFSKKLEVCLTEVKSTQSRKSLLRYVPLCVFFITLFGCLVGMSIFLEQRLDTTMTNAYHNLQALMKPSAYEKLK